MAQNMSHAVMAQRVEDAASLDDFPTPPWATRAFLQHILDDEAGVTRSAWEPACGRGHMSQVMAEYFGSVKASDIHEYGFGEVGDFTKSIAPIQTVDWIITNPPFRLAEEFLMRALPLATRGVALLSRTVFIESVGRYERLFNVCPPTIVAQYVERVPMVKGRLDPKASTATGYAWLVWDKTKDFGSTQLRWIPPSRKKLERKSDYEPGFLLRSPTKCLNESGDTRQSDLFVLS